MIASPEPWTADTLCAQVAPDEWFPDKGQSSAAVKRICRRCPVQGPCLDYALRINDKWGIYGGKSERERRAIKRKREEVKP